MLNILYVAQTYYPKIGGAERYIDRLAQAMSNRGHNVFVLAPINKTTEPELDRGYKVIRTSFYEDRSRGINYYLRAIPMSKRLGQIIKDNDIDILHFQYINPFATTVRQNKGNGARVYASIHGSGVHFMIDDWLGKRLLKRVLKNIDGVSPVSDYCGDLARTWGAPQNKVFPIYNGTDPDIFKPEPDHSKINPHTILSACRLVPRKDISTLLKALVLVKKEIPDVMLNIAGDGPDKDRLEKLARDMKISENVRFLGFVSDEELLLLYQHTGVFTLPAKFDKEAKDIEGFGIALLEAMSCSRPVIGANVGGIPSAIKPSWGFLYEPEDEIVLANYILQIMKEPKLGDQMGSEGRKAVERIYNWKYIAKQMEDMYVTVR